MDLKTLLSVLDKLAPLKLAAKWDNVGLLVEPSLSHSVKNILLTNDLTERVLKEAIDWSADMVISYHPPIFHPLKRLNNKNWKERLVIKAIENKIAIYSPHTACDAVQNGVNDWLSLCLGPLVKSEPIEQSYESSSNKLVKVVINKKNLEESKLLETIQSNFNVSVKEHSCKFELDIVAANHDVKNLLSLISSEDQVDIKILDLCSKPLAFTGMGRLCVLQNPTHLSGLVDKVKTHLSLQNLRLAIGDGWSINDKIQSVALCAGSGASVLQGVSADVFLTGEMSHHEVLDAVSNNTSVILCEHSNTERGFLKEFQNSLTKELDCDAVQIKVSEIDKDPLTVC